MQRPKKIKIELKSNTGLDIINASVMSLNMIFSSNLKFGHRIYNIGDFNYDLIPDIFVTDDIGNLYLILLNKDASIKEYKIL